MHALAPTPIVPLVETALERFSRALRERFGPRLRELVLFGSYARGEAHEDSDVDVLVVVDDLSDDERNEIVNIAYGIGLAADDWVGLSPLALSTARAHEQRATGRRIWTEIESEGVRL